MKKSEELRSPTSCFNKAASHEPVFVLRAKDAVAAQAVRHWAAMAFGIHEAAKLKEAEALADEMDKWRQRNVEPEVVVSSGDFMPTPDPQ